MPSLFEHIRRIEHDFKVYLHTQMQELRIADVKLSHKLAETPTQIKRYTDPEEQCNLKAYQLMLLPDEEVPALTLLGRKLLDRIAGAYHCIVVDQVDTAKLNGNLHDECTSALKAISEMLEKEDIPVHEIALLKRNAALLIAAGHRAHAEIERKVKK